MKNAIKTQLRFRKITMMKGKALRRHILHRKKAASFLLKLFKKTRTSPTHEKFFFQFLRKWQIGQFQNKKLVSKATILDHNSQKHISGRQRFTKDGQFEWYTGKSFPRYLFLVMDCILKKWHLHIRFIICWTPAGINV